MKPSNPPTYQQFLDAARHLRDRKAYDDGLAALIRDQGPKLDVSWSDASALDAMCRRAAWLAVGRWSVAQAGTPAAVSLPAVSLSQPRSAVRQ